MASFFNLKDLAQLQYQINNGRVDELKEKVNGNSQFLQCSEFPHKQWLIHLACNKGNFQICEFLLQKGANPNVVDQIGWTPLHCACSSARSYEICKLLIRYGAIVNVRDNDGETPLYGAVEHARGSTKICSLLIENHANVNIVDNEGLGPLDVAQHNNNVYSFLSSKGAVKHFNEEIFDRMYAKVLHLLSKNKIEEAEDTITKLSIMQPNNAQIIGLMAVVNERNGNFADALKFFNIAYAIDKSSATRLYNHARLLESEYFKDYDGAMKLYEEAIVIEQREEILFGMGDLYETMGQQDKAIEIYNKVLKCYPNAFLAMNNLGLCFMKSAKLDNNLAVIERAISMLSSSLALQQINYDNSLQAFQGKYATRVNLLAAYQLQEDILNGKNILKGHCTVCNKPASSKCSKCKSQEYCSRECQTGDWKKHKRSCGKVGKAHTGTWVCGQCNAGCDCLEYPHSASCHHYMNSLRRKGPDCFGLEKCMYSCCGETKVDSKCFER
eukprot:gene5277-7332_t